LDSWTGLWISTKVSRPLVDNDSIDLQFLSNSSNAYTRAPRLEAQLKCTAQDVISGDYINFPLKIKNYDDLREPNVLVPRVLICVLLAADDPLSWLIHSEEMLSVMKCGYWMSLKGYPAKENSHTVTVQLPKNQLFNVFSLTELMENVGRGVCSAYAK
jgi:hypothetical protein